MILVHSFFCIRNSFFSIKYLFWEVFLIWKWQLFFLYKKCYFLVHVYKYEFQIWGMKLVHIRKRPLILMYLILLVTPCTIVAYEFYWSDVFRIRTIVHCITNLSWFCNHTSYLMFSILGQWMYHDFETIQSCISSLSFPWDMEFVMVLSPYFTSDSIFFPILWQ